MNIEELKKLIDDNEIISFDIFDTLITRIVDNPETVFDIIGEKYDIDNFKKIRMDKQSEIGTILMQEKDYPHANMDEIYDYIKETTNITNTKEIKKYELKLEKELLFDNPDMHEIFDYAKNKNKKVVITSDMYIEQDDIKDILNNCGYKTIDKIYLSSTERKAKFNGDLFDLLIEKENVSPNKVLHIGDNYDHDYLLAQSKGINAYHYTNTKIERKGKNLVQSFHNGICRLIKLRNKDFFVGFGANGGLLYYSIYKELLKKNKDKYVFIARDGYNMKELFDKYTKKKTEYLYASRRSMLLASIDKIDEDSIAILPPFTFGQTVGEILDFICMREIFSLNEIKQVGFSSFDDVIKDISDMNNFKKLYKLEEQKVLEVCAKERNAAKEYFSKIKILNKDLFVFDCGWNGSSQYMLENLMDKISKDTKIEFFYTGIFDNTKSRKQLKDKNYSAYLFDIEKNVDIASKLKEGIAVVELFFGAPHNSVYKYEKDTDVLDDFENDFKYKEDILKGLEEYFKIIIDVEKKYALEIKQEDILELLTSLIENPTEEEAIKVGNIKNVDSFAGKKGEQKFIAKVTMNQLKNNENTEIYWKKALLKRPDISNEIKEFVRTKYNMNEKEEVVSIVNEGRLIRLKKSIQNNGYRTTLYLIGKKIKNKLFSNNEYDNWMKENEKELLNVTDFEYQPLISIVVPVYNAIATELIDCIESVKKQTYTNWELCLVDDHSTKEETIDTLKSYQGTDERIKIKFNKKNGHISKTSNDGIQLSDGEFIALLDNDDILAPNALFEMVKKLNEDKTLDFIYSDEDKLTVDGITRKDPFFKPDWSPNTFMSLMYTCHFAMFRKTILNKIGGFTVGLDGAQDYDLVLRFTEQTNHIGHIPKMLYHWRERAGSIASDPEAKPYALTAIQKLKEETLARRGLKGKIKYEPSVFQYRVIYEAPEELVTIIVELENKQKAEKLINEIVGNRKDNYQIIVLSEKKYNLSTEADYIIEKNNYSEYKKKIKGSYVCYIKDEIEGLTNHGLKILLGHASLNQVGCVGPKILYKNTNVIYSVGKSISGSHVLNGIDDSIPIYYCRNRLDYDTYALSSKCFVTKKNDFDKVKNQGMGYFISKGMNNVIRNDVSVFLAQTLPERIVQVSAQNDPFINQNITTSLQIEKKYSQRVLKIINTNNNAKKDDYCYKIDVNISQQHMSVSGYCFKKGINNNSNIISLILIKDQKKYKVKAKRIFDREVSYKYGSNLDFTNFGVTISTDKLKGKFKLLLLVSNRKIGLSDTIDLEQKVDL